MGRCLDTFFNFAILIVLGGCCCVKESGKQPRLFSEIEFDGFAVKSLKGVDFKALCNERIGMGGQDGYEFLRLGKDYIRVETANEYWKASFAGAEPLTTYDLAMNSFFVKSLGAVKFLLHVKPSTKSHLRSDLAYLPVGFLTWVGSEQRKALEEDNAAGKTLLDYAKQGKVRLLKRKFHKLQFEYEATYYYVDELARGDYDGDGYEDALLNVTYYGAAAEKQKRTGMHKTGAMERHNALNNRGVNIEGSFRSYNCYILLHPGKPEMTNMAIETREKTELIEK